MGLNNFNFSFPKRTLLEQVMDEYHVEAKVQIDEDGVKTYFLVPVFDNIYDRIANTNDLGHGPTRIDGTIVGNPNESLKDFIKRLGWVHKNPETGKYELVKKEEQHD